MGVLGEMIARGWEGFLARPSGTFSLRFVLQPLLAAFIAVRAGLSDARAGRPPYLLSIFNAPGGRWPLLKTALKDLRYPLIIGSLLDAIYQAITHRAIYPIELAFTVAFLAVLPYMLIRGPVTRIARLLRHAPEPRRSEPPGPR